MLFDLYIIEFSDNMQILEIDTLWNKIKNVEIDLDEDIVSNYNVSIYTDIITNLKTSLNKHIYELNYKPITMIKFNTNDVYEYIVQDSTKSVIAFQINRFDNKSYFSPVAIFFDEIYLDVVGKKIKFDNFFEFLNATEGKDKFITTFYNLIK